MSYGIRKLQKQVKWEWSLNSYKIITKKGKGHSRQGSNVSTDKMMAIFPGNQFRLIFSRLHSRQSQVSNPGLQDFKSLFLLIHGILSPTSLFFSLVPTHDSVFQNSRLNVQVTTFSKNSSLMIPSYFQYNLHHLA